MPAHYGGFETAVEEIGQRLVARGHEVTVYCRGSRGDRIGAPKDYLGMRLVHLPAIKGRAVETLSHTALSSLHLLTHRRHDVALVFNAANAPFLPLLRRRHTPVAVHVDGLEWQRAKWGPAGRRYYRWAEAYAVQTSDALIADAQGIADYYTEEFGATTELLTYGAPIQPHPRSDRIAELDVKPGEFHLVVARFEKENHVAEIVEGFRDSRGELPLLVVGSAPYADDYTARVHAAADPDPRIRMLGGVWDQELLDQLYGNCLTYVHGHSVGGTNPSLLRAMGAGADVIAYDCVFNREVLGERGRYFATSDRGAELGRHVRFAEVLPEKAVERGDHFRNRAAGRYDWDEVAGGYERLCKQLDSGETVRGAASGSRRSEAETT